MRNQMRIDASQIKARQFTAILSYWVAIRQHCLSLLKNRSTGLGKLCRLSDCRKYPSDCTLISHVLRVGQAARRSADTQRHL